MLGQLGVRADLIYLDASHDELDVRADLLAYWPLLTPAGVMFGDDYHPVWPGVVRAVDDFPRERPRRLELDERVWIIRQRR